MLTDFRTAVFVRYAAIDAVPATGIAPKFVLEQLLYKARRVQTAEGERFIALVDEIEISLSTGMSVEEVQGALTDLARWGWVRKRAEGHEVGYQSAAGGDVFYADEAYARLDRRLNGSETAEQRVRVAQEWLKEIEGVRDAGRI